MSEIKAFAGSVFKNPIQKTPQNRQFLFIGRIIPILALIAEIRAETHSPKARQMGLNRDLFRHVVNPIRT